MTSSRKRPPATATAPTASPLARAVADRRLSSTELSALFCALLLMATPTAAQPHWGGTAPHAFPHTSHGDAMARDGQTPTGKVDVATFIAETELAERLGQGSIEVLRPVDGEAANTVFEAAVIDRLIAAGYDVARPPGRSGQVTELRIVRDELPSDERPRKPVSGELSVGFGNRDSSMGLALSIDLSKPPRSLIATRLEARIRDRASNELLWEGRAEVVTREDDRRWTGEHVAMELARALFDDFPGRA